MRDSEKEVGESRTDSERDSEKEGGGSRTDSETDREKEGGESRQLSSDRKSAHKKKAWVKGDNLLPFHPRTFCHRGIVWSNSR